MTTNSTATTNSAEAFTSAARYLPPVPRTAGHGIGLIGCGFISEAQLAAYQEAGFDVVVLCDRTLAKAEARREAYAPQSRVTTDVENVLSDPAVDIVDIATHVPGRPELIRRALRAGKHVLSQKPFVSSIADGERLVEEARTTGRTLAVNHNGRWAPHFAAALALVSDGAVGEPTSADFTVYWPHDQAFEHDPHFSTMEDLILYDFGIHWFDVVAQLMSKAGDAQRVYASVGHRRGAKVPVATDADVVIEYAAARATISFRASAPLAEKGMYRIEGTEGTIAHEGHSLGGEVVTLTRQDGSSAIDLQGDWWSNGMRGTMAELMDAVETGRSARNSAETSLASLRLCFAALHSARTHVPVDPATVDARHAD
ncbi:Gfo/Idh/MocA family oxidoreductase [Paenarthrobacter sp. OM7]|uniref:Gfo/Idh/MocA family protein n=1 Tax=Paenarthrobacter sp. OM7 TaxID=3041264 RepID=UPI002469B3F1|nr:Gfo/Idh/MocA family oxidoreductase [Paenarthrobacter sp. OM7]WGM20283.1 Gfo/Idh/MocA family oxidoreductase [Paenarthrobacter sp. OM7]